jgi:hypothetical protein
LFLINFQPCPHFFLYLFSIGFYSFLKKSKSLRCVIIFTNGNTIAELNRYSPKTVKSIYYDFFCSLLFVHSTYCSCSVRYFQVLCSSKLSFQHCCQLSLFTFRTSSPLPTSLLFPILSPLSLLYSLSSFSPPSLLFPLFSSVLFPFSSHLFYLHSSFLLLLFSRCGSSPKQNIRTDITNSAIFAEE